MQTTLLDAVAPAIGLSREEAGTVGEYLSAEGLIEWHMGGGISITHAGVIEFEQAQSEPERATPHFPAINLITVQHMSHSQIQQGTVGSTQQMAHVNAGEADALKAFLDELTRVRGELALGAEAQEEMEAQIATIEAQMKSARPNRTILKAAGAAVLEILASAPGRAAVEAILKHVPDWIK
jgi:multidrug resistance efflux pump